MLAAGGSSYRVKDAMAKLARAVGIERLHAHVTYTEISLTAYANHTFRTEVAEQRVMGVNSQRIDALDYFVSQLPDKDLLVEDADRALDRIEHKGPLYNIPLSSFFSGIACSAFAFLNKGGFTECVAVFFAALLGQYIRRELMKRHINHFGTWFVCGTVAAFVYIALVGTAQHFDLITESHETGVVAALLFLVPGFPLVTAILDLIRQDFSAGISRSVYVAMLMLSAATAAWCVTMALDWSTTSEIDGYSLSPLPLFLARALASFIAAFGFATLFNTPLKACLIAATNGMIINTLRLTAQDWGLAPLAAVGLAALMAGILAHLASKLVFASRVSLSVSAVVVMIPGVPFYRAISAIDNGNVGGAVEQMVTIFLVIAAIGAGLAAARMITDNLWLHDNNVSIPKLGSSEIAAPPASVTTWQPASAVEKAIREE